MRKFLKNSLAFAVIAMLIMSMFTLGAFAAENVSEDTTATVSAETFAEEAVSNETEPEENVSEDSALVEDSAFASLQIEPANFVNNLSYMGLGMLGIFIVIGLVMIMTFVLNRVFSGKKDDEQ